MITTIQINDETHRLLTQLRKTFGSESYNDVINILIKRPISKKDSLYGFLGKRNMKQILKGLRDESDRI